MKRNVLGAAAALLAGLSWGHAQDLATALDTTDLPWITDGLPWTGQTAYSFDLQDAAQASASSNQVSVLRTRVTGPFDVQFRWAIDGGTLEFLVDGEVVPGVAPDRLVWRAVDLSRGGASNQLHELYWRFTGPGAAWVDQVTLNPAPLVTNTITVQVTNVVTVTNTVNESDSDYPNTELSVLRPIRVGRGRSWRVHSTGRVVSLEEPSRGFAVSRRGKHYLLQAPASLASTGLVSVVLVTVGNEPSRMRVDVLARNKGR